MKTKIIPAKHPSAIPLAINILEHCGLVAIPTDTVYGLAAAAFDEDCIERLYVVKGRNHTKAIALLMSKATKLDQVAIDINQTARCLAEHFWPGPLTLILKRHPSLPEILSPEPTIGVRVPDHPNTLALMDLTGPLAVTSANLSGQEPTCTAKEVLTQLNRRIHLIIDGGPTRGGIPSTVVDCTTPEIKILRPGPLTLADLKSVLS
jgi:L-threonylcarbamoyladenylate synthase